MIRVSRKTSLLCTSYMSHSFVIPFDDSVIFWINVISRSDRVNTRPSPSTSRSVQSSHSVTQSTNVQMYMRLSCRMGRDLQQAEPLTSAAASREEQRRRPQHCPSSAVARSSLQSQASTGGIPPQSPLHFPCTAMVRSYCAITDRFSVFPCRTRLPGNRSVTRCRLHFLHAGLVLHSACFLQEPLSLFRCPAHYIRERVSHITHGHCRNTRLSCKYTLQILPVYCRLARACQI